MTGSGSALVVADKTSRLQVDHRLSLRIYFRAADSTLRQARVYRKENNLIDLYVVLLRFSSLVMETIPQHREYRVYSGREKIEFRKRVLHVLSELETLKPLVQKEVSRYNNAYLPAARSSNGSVPTNLVFSGQSATSESSLSGGFGISKDHSQTGYNWTSSNSKPFNSNKQDNSQTGSKGHDDLSRWSADIGQQEYIQAGQRWDRGVLSQRQQNLQERHIGPENLMYRSGDATLPEYAQVGHNLNGAFAGQPLYSGPLYSQSSAASASVESKMSNLLLRLPAPTSETLSRHSFLGSSIRRASVSNVLTTKVQYPSLPDASPIVIPSSEHNWQSPPAQAERGPTIPSVKALIEPDPTTFSEVDMIKFEEKHSSLVDTAVTLHSQLSRQPSPPPVAAEVHCVPCPANALVIGCTEMALDDVLITPAEPVGFSEDSVQSRKPKHLHIPVRLMDDFMGVARGNIKDNLETCGVLAGSLKEGIFYVTTLIIPKQEATANSCSTTNEEEIFEYQDKHDLFQFGWIHTHPSQSCFMSSIDLHTHYSYQVMLPEAVAIVMAPTDSSRKYGIFRLVEPGGVKLIQSCDKRGFHAHNDLAGGGLIYESSGHVDLDPKLGCNVVDLRG